MKLGGDPARAFALIVGVERSEVFDSDPLIGPARDTMHWCDEFMRWGLRAERIALFVSPTPLTLPDLQQWCDARKRALPPLPTQAALQRFIVDELPLQAAAGEDASLLLVWSGHGQINLRESGRTRRLFYCDSTPSLAHNLEIVSLMKALRGKRYDGFSRQLLVVDACANHAVGFSGGRRLLDPTDFSVGLADKPGRQHVLLAAAPGQLALAAGLNARESVSKYSQSLLARLAASPSGTWPDVRRAHAEVQAAFVAGGDPTPVDWCNAEPDDVLPDSAVALLADVLSTRLVAALAGVPLPVLRSAYFAALRGNPLTEAQQQAADAGEALLAMAHTLAEMARPGGAPPPLERWAAQIGGRLAAPPLELQLWLKQAGDAPGELAAYRAGVQRELAALQDSGRLCFLLIREDPRGDGHGELQGWLFAGPSLTLRCLTDSASPLIVQPDGSGRASGLAALLDAAMVTAEELGIDLPDLVIELALPTARVDDDIDALPMGRPAHERPLGTRYAIVRRLADRLDALARPRGRRREVVDWLKAAPGLRERLEAHGLQIGWIAPEQIRAGLLAKHLDDAAQACCVGLQRAMPGRDLDGPTKELLFDDALAFACWSLDEWTAADAQQLAADLGSCTGKPVLHKLWSLRRKAGFAVHPSARLQLLWDDPAHNPYDLQLQAIRP